MKLDGMMKETKICTCECHKKDGHKVIHSFACCNLCYEKYIDINGNIDINRLGMAFKLLYNEIPTFKRYGDDINWLHL